MPKKKEPEGGKRGKGKRRRPAKLNIGATRAAQKFKNVLIEFEPKLEGWEEKRQLAAENGRRIETIRAERNKYQVHAKILSARRELLEFAVTLKSPGLIEEFKPFGIISQARAREELEQVKGLLKHTGEIVKGLLVEGRGGPIIAPNPDSKARLTNYNNLLAELDLDVKRQRAVVISAKRTGTAQQAAQAQREELILTGRQASARIEKLNFLIDNPMLRLANGFKTEADAVKAIEVESRKLTSASKTLETLNRNRRK